MKKVNSTEMKHGTKEDYLLLEKHEKDFERETQTYMDGESSEDMWNYIDLKLYTTLLHYDKTKQDKQNIKSYECI